MLWHSHPLHNSYYYRWHSPLIISRLLKMASCQIHIFFWVHIFLNLSANRPFIFLKGHILIISIRSLRLIFCQNWYWHKDRFAQTNPKFQHNQTMSVISWINNLQWSIKSTYTVACWRSIPYLSWEMTIATTTIDPDRPRRVSLSTLTKFPTLSLLALPNILTFSRISSSKEKNILLTKNGIC